MEQLYLQMGGVAKYLDTLINLHWLIWSNTSYYVHNLGLHGHAYKQTNKQELDD